VRETSQLELEDFLEELKQLEMLILGVDPSLRSTGFGVIEGQRKTWRCVGFGVISCPSSLGLGACLVRIAGGMRKVLEQFRPEVCAIEGLFFLQNIRTAITLGHARGVAIAVLSEAGVPVFEYAPRRVKQSVVGCGGAQKLQVAEMLRPLLGLKELPPSDAADALALALTHAHSLQNPGLGGGKSV